MNDHDALLRTIAETPHDDTLRLAYADWLDEHGDDFDRQHAELIRVQVEAERIKGGGCAVVLGEDCDGTKREWCIRCRFVHRANDLLAAVEPVVRRGKRCGKCKGKGEHFDGYDRWRNCPDCHGGWTGTLAEFRGHWVDPWTEESPTWHHRCDWSRGFPFRVYCTLAEYQTEVGRKTCPECGIGTDPKRYIGIGSGGRLAAGVNCPCVGRQEVPITFAEQLLREHGTITEVVLTDREPSERIRENPPSEWVWTVRGENQVEITSDLPRGLFDLLDGGTKNSDNWVCRYLNRDYALTALARAAADHARGLAGLPVAWGATAHNTPLETR